MKNEQLKRKKELLKIKNMIVKIFSFNRKLTTLRKMPQSNEQRETRKRKKSKLED